MSYYHSIVPVLFEVQSCVLLSKPPLLAPSLRNSHCFTMEILAQSPGEKSTGRDAQCVINFSYINSILEQNPIKSYVTLTLNDPSTKSMEGKQRKPSYLQGVMYSVKISRQIILFSKNN